MALLPGVGEFGFSCAINMVHGSRTVTPGDSTEQAVVLDDAEPMDAAATEAQQAAETKAEIHDVSRRVTLGAVLTAELFAVMAHELFGAGWVPALLLNAWWQMALITPVMADTGWPVHRTGGLALRHRAADMNTLITLGTSAAFGHNLLVTVAPGLFPAAVREVRPGEVGADVAYRHAAGVEPDHDLVDAFQAGPPLADQPRLQRAGPVPRHLEIHAAGLGVQPLGRRAVAGIRGARSFVRLIPEVLGQLRGQAALEDRLGHLPKQTVSPTGRLDLRPGPLGFAAAQACRAPKWFGPCRTLWRPAPGL